MGLSSEIYSLIFFAGASNGLPYIRVRVKIEAQVDTVHVQTIAHSSSSEQLSRLDYGLLQSMFTGAFWVLGCKNVNLRSRCMHRRWLMSMGLRNECVELATCCGEPWPLTLKGCASAATHCGSGSCCVSSWMLTCIWWINSPCWACSIILASSASCMLSSGCKRFSIILATLPSSASRRPATSVSVTIRSSVWVPDSATSAKCSLGISSLKHIGNLCVIVASFLSSTWVRWRRAWSRWDWTSNSCILFASRLANPKHETSFCSEPVMARTKVASRMHTN